MSSESYTPVPSAQMIPKTFFILITRRQSSLVISSLKYFFSESMEVRDNCATTERVHATKQ